MKLYIQTLIILFAGCFIVPGCQNSEDTPKTTPPEVSVYTTKAEDVPIYKTFVGQTFGAKDIAIRARVEGVLRGMHFEEGKTVAAGDLLYVIDSSSLQAGVASQKGLLAGAETEMLKAKRDLERYKPLAEKNAISKSDLDAAKALYRVAQASVDAARANLKEAEIQLGYTRIHSPISGIIGKTRAKVGDFVGREPNPVILNMVSNTDSILVEFFLTETLYLDMARNDIKKREKEEEEEDHDIQLILADGSLYPHRGTPNFMNRKVDSTTGGILVQVSFPNPDNLMRPGQFAEVKAKLMEVNGGILIPQRSVTELQDIKRVFTVDDQNTVQERHVKLGPTVDNFWLVLEGLEPGDKVIYEGLQNAKDGIVVVPKPVQVDRITKDGR